MGYKKINADNLNKILQFEVREPAQSVSFNTNPEITDAILDTATLQVELVMKNKPNQVFIKQKFSELKAILKEFFPKLNRLMPFSFDKSLVLSDDAYLLITLKWDFADQITNFEYAVNTMINQTYNGLIIKEKLIDGEVDLDTEFYPILMIGADIKNVETIVLFENENGVLENQKISYNQSLIKSGMGDLSYASMLLQKDQKVKLTADNAKVYLVQVD